MNFHKHIVIVSIFFFVMCGYAVAQDTTPPNYSAYQENYSNIRPFPSSIINISVNWVDSESGMDHSFLATNETGEFRNRSGLFDVEIRKNITQFETNQYYLTGMEWHPNGSYLYVGNQNHTPQVLQYDCSNFDVRTCSLQHTLFTGNNTIDVTWGESGDELYIGNGTVVRQYIGVQQIGEANTFTCTEAYNISTCSKDASQTLVGGTNLFGRGIEFDKDGDTFFTINNTGVIQYACSTSYDLSSCNVDKFRIYFPSAINGHLEFSKHGRKMFLTTDFGQSIGTIHQYRCSDGFNITSCQDSDNYELDWTPSLSNQLRNTIALGFNDRGNTAYITDRFGLFDQEDNVSVFSIDTDRFFDSFNEVTSTVLADFDWQNSSISEAVYYKVWGVDAGFNYNSTSVKRNQYQRNISIANLDILDINQSNLNGIVNKKHTGQIRINISEENGFNDIDIATVNLSMPNGTISLDNASTTSIRNYSSTYTKAINYSFPDYQSGIWTIDARVVDRYGDDNASTEFNYQIASVDDPAYTQNDGSIYEDIPYVKTVTVSNNQNIDFKNYTAAIDIFSETATGSVAVVDEDGNSLDVSEFASGGKANVTIPELGSNTDKNLDVSIKLRNITINEVNFTRTTGIPTDVYQLNMTPKGSENPENLDAYKDVDDPNDVSTVELFVDGTEVTTNPDYEFDYIDNNNDGVKERATWNVPGFASYKNYTVEAVNGNTITINTEAVVTNKPVTSGKVLQWRKDVQIVNSNNFSISNLDTKIRIARDARNVEVDGSPRGLQLDDQGSYVPITTSIDPNANESIAITYQTDTISFDVNKYKKDHYWADKTNNEHYNVSIQNILPDRVENVEHTRSLVEANNIDVIDTDTNTVLSEQDNAEGSFTFNISGVNGTDTRNIKVEYNVPIASVNFTGKQNISNGNTLYVYDIRATSATTREEVWFEPENTSFDCVQATASYNVVTNKSYEVRCGSENDGASDDSATVIEIGTLSSNNNIRIGVERRRYKPIVDSTSIVMRTIGNNLASLGLVVVAMSALYVGSTRFI